MQDFPVGLLGFLEDGAHFGFHFSRRADGLRDELDQVARLLQQVLDAGDVRKIVPPAASLHQVRDGIIASLPDQLTRTDDTLGSRDESRHAYTLP